MTEMPHASASLIPIPDHDDSVEENDKDFAKLKGEEEDNTPTVVPMSQDSVEENDKDFAKLKGEEEEDHTPVVPMSQDSDSDEEEEKPPFTEDDAREAFDLWRQMLVVEYADQSEYEKRFKFFKDSLRRKVHHCWGRYGMNILSLADRSPEEIHASGDHCNISIRRIHEFYETEFKAW